MWSYIIMFINAFEGHALDFIFEFVKRYLDNKQCFLMTAFHHSDDTHSNAVWSIFAIASRGVSVTPLHPPDLLPNARLVTPPPPFV